MIIIINTKITPKIVILICPAPVPSPAAIVKRYINSSGSLIAALNLTIDKAPTRPNDNGYNCNNYASCH